MPYFTKQCQNISYKLKALQVLYQSDAHVLFFLKYAINLISDKVKTLDGSAHE